MNRIATTALASPRAEAHDERQGAWLMAAGGVLLGTLGVFVIESHQHPLTAVWGRCAFGALALLAWGAATGRLHELRLRGRPLALAAGAGLLMVFNWWLFFAAIERVPLGIATVVVHAQPFWVMALAAWWLREPIRRHQVGAAALALVGLALSCGVAGTPVHLGDGAATGLLMCLGGSLTYAVVTLIAKAARTVSSFALAWWQCAVGTVVLLWWPMLHGWPQGVAPWAWLSGLGAIHTALAYVLMYAGMARLAAGRIALLQFVYPGTAVLVDWAFYGHALGPLQLLGVGLMGAALLQQRRT